MKKKFTSVLFSLLALCAGADVSPMPFGADITWDSSSLIFNGRRVTPVMGEIHYSRLPADEWRAEIRKMKEGGVNVIATYVFWNHIEEIENQFDWSGQRNLRAFLEACKAEGMPVILRVGPFCHGEARNGGIPDWVFASGAKSRSEDPLFIDYVTRLYRQIFTQVQGLQWKDGGPVMAMQFDNEYRGHGSYLMKLKSIANEIGFELPFYTRTGWPDLKTPVPFGEMIPLYGDYADGFWDRSTKEGAGNYYKAFNFHQPAKSTAIATEQLGDQSAAISGSESEYPYFSCELGGGMMTAYHRRPYIYPEDALSMAIVQLGSGSNLLGYYMYHGGTNPEGKTAYLNETQRTVATNYNDLPDVNYDFQAPLGEFGQKNPHYYSLRPVHLFMQDFGHVLAPMRSVFPEKQNLERGEDNSLRWAYRTDGKSAFVFVNNYERLQQLSPKRGVRFSVNGVTFPSRALTVPSGAMGILPVNIGSIDYATASLVAERDGRVYLAEIPGMPVELKYRGKVYRNLKPKGPDTPVVDNVFLLTADQAARLFLAPESPVQKQDIAFTKVREAAPVQRAITLGAQKVAQSPLDADYEAAAVYTIPLPDERHGRLMSIMYRGDTARLYADGKLVADNFYNGRPFLMGLWRLPAECRQLELRILPLQENMPVYFPREARLNGPAEEVIKITVE